MSMSEPTDDQLDGLFRKSAEEFDPPFDPVAWRDMKTRLDANDRTTGGVIWEKLLRWGLPVLLLVLLTGGAWFAYRRTSPVNVKANSRVITNARPTLNQKAKQPPQTEAMLTSDNEPVRTNTVDLKEPDANAGKQPTNLAGSVAERIRPEKGSDKAITRPVKEALDGTEVATKRPTSAYGLKTKRTKSSRLKPGKSVVVRRNDVVETSGLVGSVYRLDNTTLRANGLNRKQRKAATRKSYEKATLATNYAGVSAFSASRRSRRPVSTNQVSKLANVVVRGSGTIPATTATIIDLAGSATPTEIIETGPVTLPALSELTARPAKWPKLVFTDRAVTVQPDTTARSVIHKLTSERGFSIRFAVAPDLSTVGLKNFSRPGTNVGLLLEYRLAPHWSIQAGVIQSTKVYRASGNDYGYLPDYLDKYRSNLIGVDGRCNMLDIPINLRYDIALRTRSASQLLSRWFISGGVTSYIMKQEDYSYEFVHVYPSTLQQMSESTGGYGFSNLNFSIGYERALSRKLSLQIEPFIKAPLKGVGYFKVNLLSTGAFFSIRYKLSK